MPWLLIAIIALAWVAVSIGLALLWAYFKGPEFTDRD